MAGLDRSAGCPTRGRLSRPALRRYPAIAGAVVGGAVSLALVGVGTTAAALVNTVTVLVLAIVLVSGDRRSDALRRTRVLLLGALGSAFLSGLMPVVYAQITGHPPTSPWAGDAVALSYVPLTIAGLLLIPRGTQRAGHRARAIADGLLAASSLWYLLEAVGIAAHYHLTRDGGLAVATAFAYPLGDVFVVSAGLTVLARSPVNVRRMVAWMVAGLSVVATNDIWSFVAGHPSVWTALTFQTGLLLLLGSASAPAVAATAPDQQAGRLGWALGSLPFLPLIASMGVTGRMVVQGHGMPTSQVLPALVVAVALVLRQLAGSRDKQRLVLQLQAREASLQAALRIDDLTGLANRLGFSERLQEALGDGGFRPVTIALLDLNEFKLINDRHGHATGDEVLRVVGERLAATVRGADTVARLGGDEFGLVLTTAARGDQQAILDRLVGCFDAPIPVREQLFRVHASIGVVSGRAPETASQLMAHADAAMYRAKADRATGSRVAVLDAVGRVDVARQLQIKDDVAHPDLSQFHVAYQPVVDLATGAIRGVEALIRWRHPAYGDIAPEAFIPIAEQCGSIRKLGEFVLTTATRDLGELLRRHPERRFRVGVNVSPRQLAIGDFVGFVRDALAAAGLGGEHLALEITEQAFEANLDAVAGALAMLAEDGVDVAIDDFGTGYSSLRYLHRLPLTTMKIDRDFIRDVAGSTASRQLVASLTVMASGLGLSVVAEGIETLDQLRILQQYNCELGQGYLFSAPVPIETIARLVDEQHAYVVGSGDAAPLITPRIPRARAAGEGATA